MICSRLQRAASRAASARLCHPATPSLPARRLLSVTAARQGGGGHYEPPSGWLWGVPPGQKAEPEGWEAIWYWGFFGSLAVTVVAYAFKPDSSIQTWALEEARRQLEQEGVLPDSQEASES